MQIELSNQDIGVITDGLNRRIEQLTKAVQSPNLSPAVLQDLESSLARRMELRARLCPESEDYQLQADQEDWLAQIRSSYNGM